MGVTKTAAITTEGNLEALTTKETNTNHVTCVTHVTIKIGIIKIITAKPISGAVAGEEEVI